MGKKNQDFVGLPYPFLWLSDVFILHFELEVEMDHNLFSALEPGAVGRVSWDAEQQVTSHPLCSSLPPPSGTLWGILKLPCGQTPVFAAQEDWGRRCCVDQPLPDFNLSSATLGPRAPFSVRWAAGPNSVHTPCGLNILLSFGAPRRRGGHRAGTQAWGWEGREGWGKDSEMCSWESWMSL